MERSLVGTGSRAAEKTDNLEKGNINVDEPEPGHQTLKDGSSQRFSMVGLMSWK